ncbi:MAG: helix-turn-helix transcriptional regulator [bacterium]|nr:helix-turn-helix transcriptional regulator [bacterium]
MRTNKISLTRSIGQRLNKIRKIGGFSRHEMASQLGVTENGYGKNETGLHIPGLKQLQVLSKRFNISMDWFLFEMGAMYLKERAEGKKEAEAESAAAAIERKPEVRELLDYMEREPKLYYEVMLHFQEFKSKGEEKST